MVSPLFLCLVQMDIVPGPDSRFGFTIVGDCPLLVEDCSPCSPAGRAGLRAGDFVMEVNGIPVRHHEMAAALIKASQGRTLRLGVLSLGPRHKRSTSLEDGPAGGEWARLDRKHKALEFNMKVRQADRKRLSPDARLIQGQQEEEPHHFLFQRSPLKHRAE